MNVVEHKSFASFELKDADSGIITGYAATYKRDSDGDRFEPGAFGGSIKDKKGRIPIFLHHERQLWAGASTDLAEDKKGLWMQAQLFLDASIGRDAWGTIKGATAAGFPVGLSVGFITQEADWDEESRTRVIKAVDLWETSITPFPANKWAGIEDLKTLRDYERLTRDVCKCSAAEAKRLLALLPLALSVDTDRQSLTSARDVRSMKHTINLGAALRDMKETVCLMKGQ